MSTPEEAQQLLLDDSGDFLQTGTEHHYIQVRCRNENKPLWLVPFRVKQEELLRVSDVLEQIQMGRILREGFFWPFDLVRSDEMQGYVLHPFSMDAYPSVRRFLPSSDTPRWTIAVHLFRRIGQLNREGLTLNGSEEPPQQRHPGPDAERLWQGSGARGVWDKPGVSGSG